MNFITVNGLDGKADSFVDAYAQLEWQLNDNWMLYGRVEESFSNEERAGSYQSMIGDVVTSQLALGTRFDFARRHAIKLEVSRLEVLGGEESNQVSVEWSLVYP